MPSQDGNDTKAAGSSASEAELPSVLLVFPSSLTARQRAALHALGEAKGLEHASAGDGDQRHIRLGVKGGKEVKVAGTGSGTFTDDQLSTLLSTHLHLKDAPSFFSQPPSASSQAPSGVPGQQRKPGSKPGSNAGQGSGVTSGPIPDVEAWVAEMVGLVEMERQAEVAQTLEANTLLSPETAQARGRALLNLRVSDLEGGLLGRTLITLVSNKGYAAGAQGAGAPELPPHKFGAHDVVALRPNKGPSEGPPLCTGVVYRLKDTCVIVAVDEVPEEGLDQPLRLEQLANEVTYKRLKTTLGALSRAAVSGGAGGGGTITGPQGRGAGGPTPGAVLVDVAFGKREPRFVDPPPSWTPVNQGLDDSQRAAVSLALSAKDVALVHGPPGTGKTTAVVEIILQEVARGSRVLAASASNIAVDNLVERLVRANPKMRVMRMGHPARLLPQVLDSSLEAHVLKSDNSGLAKDCRKEIKALNAQLMKLGPRERSERRAIQGDLRRLAREERQRQEAAVREVVAGAQVIASTLTGLLHHHLESEVFDVAVIDEAGQALEAACWAALLKAPRAVMAGDHLQLPPTVVSEEAAAKGLGRTLFERLQGMYGEGCSEMLTVQYRMNSAIMTWSSDALYQGRVTAHSSVADHTLADLLAAAASSAASTSSSSGKPGGAKSGSSKTGSKKGATAAAPSSATKSTAGEGDTSAPAGPLPVLLLIDTAGCGFEEEQEEEGDSKGNPGEAKAVMAHVQRLLRSGLAPGDIGIITPYNAQVALLRELRPEKLSGLEISSVDGFQGREKEAIVLSMVRSNDKGEVGFLADQRRMNVAVTRARRHVAIVCDTETVSHDPFLKGLVSYFEAHGEYCSAAELVPQ